MPDIHGFLSDPGEDNTVTIPAGTSEAQAKELVKKNSSQDKRPSC